MKPPPSAQLVNLLIGKSILETLLVGTIAVVVYLSTFPPTFHGWGEAVPESRSIAGWAVNDAAGWERVEVQLFVDDRLQGSQTANLSRPDVAAAGWARDEWHGYKFTLPESTPGNHEARIYALHRNGDRYSLQLLGDPIKFVVNGDGSWKAPG